MFNFNQKLISTGSICLILIAFFNVQLYGAPSKVSTNTVASKLAPAGAVGAKPAVIKKVAKPVAKAQTTAKPVAKATATAKKVVAKAPAKTPAKAPAKAVAKVVKKESVVEKFAPQLKKKDKKPAKKKVVKMRKQVIDGKVCMWGSSAEDAETSADAAVRKFVGRKGDFQVKDCVITADGGKFYCLMRFNYSDQIPETWYLETEMVAGFGKNKMRAFSNAVSKARSRVKSIRSSAGWNSSNSTVKDSSEMGFIPYDVVFATAGKSVYCKIFFRYLKPR